jgi:hypothetical protein
MDGMNVTLVRQWLERDPELEHSDVDTGRRTTPEKSRTKQEPAQASVIAWLSEASDEKGGQLRPAKIRAGWRSTSGLAAPPAVRRLVVPPPTRHFAVQQLQHPHMNKSLPSMKVEREIKPALRRSASPVARRSGQRIAFEEDAKLGQTRWFERVLS